MRRLLLYTFLSANLLTNLALAENKPLIYFKTGLETLGPGSEFSIIINIDSQESVNVIDLEITYSNLDFINFNDADSIVDIWQTRTKVLSENVIELKGGLTDPFIGEAAQIIKLNFRAISSGLAELSFKRADTYLADGLGTKVEGQNSPLAINIVSGAPVMTLNEPKDDVAPTLKVELAENPIEKLNLIVFSASDKGSGVKETYFREREWISWSEWRSVANPVLLTANTWMFQIKAFDNQNNTTEQTIYVKSVIIKRIFYILIIAAILAAAYFLLKTIIQKKKNLL